MSQQPGAPPPIPSERSEPRGNRTNLLLRGLAIGVAISAVIWIVGFMLNSEVAFIVALWAAGIKYLVALVMLFSRDWRMFATGLFCSLPIGAAIFFGVCTTGLILHG